MTSTHPIRVATRLTALVADAAGRARALGEQVLVSVTERASLQASELLHAAERAARERLFPTVMYWERPSEQFALGAFGATLTIREGGDDRFRKADAQWSGLLRNAIVEDASEGATGTGPVLTGGFAFDPRAARSQAWRDFPPSALVLPRLLVTVVGGACWLTATLLVSPDGEPDLDPESVATLHADLLAAASRESRPAGSAAREEELEDLRPATAWNALVAEAVTRIERGEMEKVVAARAVHAMASAPFDAGHALDRLRAAHPDCYIFSCWRGDSVFLGASPERLVRLDGREVQTSSLAGSARRGASAQEDAALAAALLASPKDRAEHAVVRRSLCTALGEMCDDVSAAAEPSLLSLANVHHLHTAVRATLRPGHTLLEVLAKLHPTPAVGGEPREAAMRFIRDREELDRGWYAAPVGWIGRGSGEFAVALRSALVRGREAWLFAGCGIVADSDPDAEYAESQVKLRPMKAALA